MAGKTILAGVLIFYTWVFLVTWNEYELKGLCNDEHKATHHPQWDICPRIDYYTIEITTRSIRLQTMSDVNKFIPHNVAGFRIPGSLIPNAFNIKVTEETP